MSKRVKDMPLLCYQHFDTVLSRPNHPGNFAAQHAHTIPKHLLAFLTNQIGVAARNSPQEGRTRHHLNNSSVLSLPHAPPAAFCLP